MESRARTHELFNVWSKDPYFDTATHAELSAIADDEAEITERFYRNLEFGTGGLRGILGAGTNRMNKYTIALATEAFARFVDSLGEDAKQRGIAIAYDSRNYSPEFAEVAATIFATHDITVYLSDELRPTPMLSFSVRYHNCVGGVMVTASHNPAEYNGYKAYGEDGGQMPPQSADIIMNEMAAIDDIRNIHRITMEEGMNRGLIHIIGPELDVAYQAQLDALRINRETPGRQSDMKIVFTPLHGTGNKPVRRILKQIGFDQVLTVPQQMMPDGDFPTVDSPNPESRKALQMAIDLADKEDASLVIATDPDGDRTGLALRNEDGEYEVLNGNQIGLLIMDYILSAKKMNDALPAKSFVVTTIVSSRLTRKVAEHYGVQLYTTLTGFKYIGELIKDLDENGDQHYQFGFEESYGYLAGTEVRDKDAVVAAMLIAEMAASARMTGQTIKDKLNQFYDRFGYGMEDQFSIQQEGKVGQERIQALLDSLRAKGGDALGDLKVRVRSDYSTGVSDNYEDGSSDEITLPESDVLMYQLDGDDWICLRPSGTEPKVKVYYGAYGEDRSDVERRMERYRQTMQELVDAELAAL